MWSPRHWWAALGGAVVTFLAIGLPTDLIPNPIFGRAIEPTWWSMPVLVATSIIGGLLLATYVNVQGFDRPARVGGIGGLLAYFAVGCPVCNKAVLIALGTTGAMNWFAPVQLYLAIVALLVMMYALHKRLATMGACELPQSYSEAMSPAEKDQHV